MQWAQRLKEKLKDQTANAMLTNHSVIMLNPWHKQEMKTERIVGCLGKSFQSHMAKSKLQEAAAKRHGSALEDVTKVQEARQSKKE